MSSAMSNHDDNFTLEQVRFMRWLALPKAERQPKTQAALAKEFDIVPDTLSRWKDIPGFREKVNQLAREFLKDDVPEILLAIRREAKKGSVPHINMALAMAGLEVDVANAGKGPVGGDSARDELARRITQLAARSGAGAAAEHTQ